MTPLQHLLTGRRGSENADLSFSGPIRATLQAKAEKMGGDAKVKADEQLTALHQKREVVAEKLKELSSSSGNAWEQLKTGIDAALEDLGNAYKKAVAEFSKS